MSRVIQDSDDESDADLEVEVHQTAARDASPKQSASDASSTEALRRQIEAAHRAHLQSQYATHGNSTPVIFEKTYGKRKAPPEFDFQNPSTGTDSSRKTPVPSGHLPKGTIGGSPANLQQDCSLVDGISQQIHQIDATNWILQGTMREAYAQHDPNAMFPEPSSTVPNATLTQQRVMEGVLAPALLGSDVDSERTPFQPEASIPWSEYLKSPTNTGEQPKSSAHYSHASQNLSVPMSEPLLDDAPYPSASQPNRRLSLTLVGCPSTQEMDAGVADTQGLAIFHTEEVAFEAAPLQASSSSTVNKSIPGKTSTSSRQARETRYRPSPGPTSDDELADLGLPREQYKPRPSRSRSLKAGIQEPIDYSVRPEKATKPRRRRKLTPATTSFANPPSTPDRIKQICEMGFTPTTSAKAMKQNNGDVTQSVNWLITNAVADDQLVSYNSPMSRGDNNRDNNRAAATTDTIEDNGGLSAGHLVNNQTVSTGQRAGSNNVNHDIATVETNNTSFVADLKSPTKVQVVIPAKSPKPAVDASVAPGISRRKAKRRKTTLDQPEPIATTDAANVEKKRGRGRPKKAAKTTEVVNEEEEHLGEQVRDSPPLSTSGIAWPALEQQQAVVDGTISKTTKPVRGSGSLQIEDAKTAVATSRSTPEPQELPDRPEVEPITPQRVKKPASREQPSTNKAKVPYRVGLSKRTRIAPLLRVIKK